MRKTIFRQILLLAVCISLVFNTAGCANSSKEPKSSNNKTSIKPVSESTFLLGTTVDITIYDKTDEEEARKIIEQAFERIDEIEKKMTINNAETSEIISVNNASGKEAIKVSPDTFFVLEKGKYYSELSGGEFDITIGPIVKLWNIGTEYAAVPKPEDIKASLPLVNYRDLILDKNTYTAKLAKPGMKVDLGAIAKGYAADEVASILTKNGVGHAIINLGGNVLTIGRNPNGNLWKIGIQDPFSTRGNYFGILPLENKTVVSSGSYERYFEQDGKKYHHILEPKTGYPAENELVGVSIVTDKSIDGDGLSTTTFLLGLEKGMELIEKLPGVEAIFITNDKKVYLSSGLKDAFQITNPEFKLAD